MKVGYKIKKMRELKGFTQEYMAQELGIQQRTYSMIENDETNLNLDRLSKIAELFEIPAEQLLTFDEKVIFHNIVQHNPSHFVTNGAFYQMEKELYEKLLAAKDAEIAAKDALIATLQKLVGG